ncbi:MAG: Fic family protein [Candidatus Tokpelaia sp.]|uniref:Fic family protein n=1 Tax=Candidatus Tokpelaia sp. TaxID=2233777 RepID=UPI00123853DE|nr:Fic/DOC family N-terminal domain-containing protein [Candidatus Tokpelaia sp.]KAA6205043.1 MAG: Fic family protein [Candidatus Tokpelaia sp.]KAA6205044.1 MAG: Fic family protein [Candidatus Tokpelaia sp.]KAA6207105.1 MAG: Fic family protein [Candidatus Tokpelaia sp.]KAA6406024.1 Fic family protein [Candidatus Tokpelaia sp.]
MQNLDLSNAVNYHYNKFPPQELNYKIISKILAAAAAKLGRYDQVLKNMRNDRLMLAPMRDREAVISSKIEGTISTIDDVLVYRANQESEQKADATLPQDVQEVSLYAEAMELAQKSLEEGRPFSASLLKNIHAKLLSHGRGKDKDPGSFKTEQNYVGSYPVVSFIPIRAESLRSGIENLFNYIEYDENDGLIKTAIAHVEFESLHPFKDGNGRIGRMLIPLILWKFGIISSPYFYISDYFEQNKNTYIRLMREVSQNNMWTEWVVFFLKGIEIQAAQNLEKVEEIHSLYNRLLEKFSELPNSRYAKKALDFLFTRPIFDNNIFTNEQKSGIPKQTAARYSQSLYEKGFLKIVREGSGPVPARYSFEPLMQILRV